MSYKAWEENNKLPDFILEITSATTQRSAGGGSGCCVEQAQAQDEQDKPIKYARLGVKEYFQYDPSGDYLNPRLKGSQFTEGQYKSIEGEFLDAGSLSIYSSVLDLNLRLVNDGKLRFYNPNTGKILPSYQELEQAIKDAIPRLQKIRLSIEQIATALNLSLEKVQQFLEESHRDISEKA